MNNYQELAIRTFQRHPLKTANIRHMKAGIIGEYGEIIDCFKKMLYTPSRFKTGSIPEEWADGLWYIAVWHEIEGRKMEWPDDDGDAGFAAPLDKLDALIMDLKYLADMVRMCKLEELTVFWFQVAGYCGINTEEAAKENIDKLKERWT